MPLSLSLTTSFFCYFPSMSSISWVPGHVGAPHHLALYLFPALPFSPSFTYLSLLIRPDSLTEPAYSHLWSFAHTASPPTSAPPHLPHTEYLLILRCSAQSPHSVTNSCFNWLPRIPSSPVARGFESCLDQFPPSIKPEGTSLPPSN